MHDENDRSADEALEASRKQERARWESALDQSPVFADPTKPASELPPPDAPAFQDPSHDAVAGMAGWPIVAPRPDDTPASLDVGIDALFSVASAPADSAPAVDLLVTLTPNGPPLLDPKTGPIMHLVLALDVSASMNADDKYPVLTRALTNMMNELTRDGAVPVLVSVVVFARGSQILFRDVPARELPARKLLDAIDHSPLRFTRYTDIVGALSRAGRIAADSVRNNKALPVRIYVLTDGRPQDVPGARAVMKRIHSLPVDIDGLSFGDDADVAYLSNLISGQRGGTVKHVRSDTIEVAFGRIGELAQRVVTPRAILDVELRPGVVGGSAFRFRPLRFNYGDDAFENGRRFSRDLGTLESGRSYWLLFQVRLPVAQAAETEIGSITLRLPGFGGPRVFERLASIQRHGGDSDGAKAAVDLIAARKAAAARETPDPAVMIETLRARRDQYAQEQRDVTSIDVIDRAIDALVRTGSLAALSTADQAALAAQALSRRPASASM
jgi:uncharacterized protein YegL